MTLQSDSVCTFLPVNTTIGILGGGQLGRMTAMAAAHMGYKTIIFTDEEDAPASHAASATIVAPYTDIKALERFANIVDIITLEFENIPIETLSYLEKKHLIAPHKDILSICRHRQKEKTFLNQHGIETAPWIALNDNTTEQEIQDFITKGDAILKTSEFGYDGHGQKSVHTLQEVQDAWQHFNKQPCILERKLSFTQEISIIIAQNDHGHALYPVCDNVHLHHILHQTLIPARLSDTLTKKACNMARTIAQALKLRGILCIEMFVIGDTLIVNEMAPRPHNSGHWTIDAAITSQFEQHIRAVCNLPLGATDYTMPCVMTNLLGADIHHINKHLENPYNKIHLYGKKEAKEKRKMGHMTTLIPHGTSLS